MAPQRIRRAIGLAAVLSLLLATTATADTITADGVALTAGAQTSVHLGDVPVGQTRWVDVDFVLACSSTSHVTAGSTLAVVLAGLIVPGDGSATVSPASIDVPATWPQGSATCPPGTATTSTAPAHVEVTAPSTTGTGLEFDVLFAPDPDSGAVSNFIAIAIRMNVVDPATADTTPPSLHDVPGPMLVTTYDDSAVVTWQLPTATDTVDPDPSVACDPDSGSTFALGDSTVTCVATDAAGNQATASFEVTVVHVSQLEGRWGAPLDDRLPALIGRLGRTVPLRLVVTADGAGQGPAAIDAPTLWVSALGSCAADAAAAPSRDAGAFEWGNGAWQLNLRTGDLGGGCWRLEAQVDGTAVATAVIQLADGGVAAAARRH